jgi:type I restriction enzyme, S subunit
MRDVMIEFHDGPHATPAPVEAGPVYLGIKNITDAGLLDLSETRRIAPQDFAKWTRRVKPEKDDVVFTYEATLHRYALIPEGFIGCLGRRLALIRPDRTVILPRFLHFFMLGPTWRETVTSRIISGSTVDRIPIINFPDFPIVVPDLDYQRVVVEVLGALDDLIENNRRRIDLLEQMARAIYREWFVYFRYPGHDNLVSSPLGPIPDGWEVKTLGDVIDVDKGLSYKGSYLTETGVPMANLKCFRPAGGFRRDGTKPYSGPFKPKHEVVPGDLIVANTDLTQAGAVIGTPAFVPRRGFESGGIISHHLFAIRCAEPELIPWLYQTFHDDRFRNYARGVASGTTVLGFRPTDLLSYQVAFPLETVVKAFGELAANFSHVAEDLTDAVGQLFAIRDLLLPRLVTGQIDVSSIELDAVVESVS